MPNFTEKERVEMLTLIIEMEGELINFPYSRYAGPLDMRRQNGVIKRVLMNIRVLKNKFQDSLEEV